MNERRISKKILAFARSEYALRMFQFHYKGIPTTSKSDSETTSDFAPFDS